jgi:hypothetical protein
MLMNEDRAAARKGGTYSWEGMVAMKDLEKTSPDNRRQVPNRST